MNGTSMASSSFSSHISQIGNFQCDKKAFFADRLHGCTLFLRQSHARTPFPALLRTKRISPLAPKYTVGEKEIFLFWFGPKAILKLRAKITLTTSDLFFLLSLFTRKKRIEINLQTVAFLSLFLIWLRFFMPN